MPSARRTSGVPRAAVAAVLVIVGLAAFGLWRVLSGTEDLPFTDGASAPTTAHVTKDKTYSLAVPGGVPAMLAHGVPPAQTNDGQSIGLRCTWSAGGADRQTLDVTAESTSTKAENTVGHFVAPVTGDLHIDCDGWGAMFVPDSDDRAADLSGWALLVAIITLTAGVALGLSVLRTWWERNSGGDDQVEADGDVAHIGRQNGEVGRDERGDIGT